MTSHSDLLRGTLRDACMCVLMCMYVSKCTCDDYDQLCIYVACVGIQENAL